jgi:hypothetical protein
MTPSPRQVPSAKVGEPLRFRRVFVPESELWQRIQPGHRYIPMEAAEFDRQVARSAADATAHAKPRAGIVFARYTAELDDRFRLVGTGAWKINVSTSRPSLIQLGGLGFALEEPRWTSFENAPPAQVAAKLGAVDSGDIMLAAERSGKLEFRWLMNAAKRSDGQWDYDLSLPYAPVHQFELTLPAGLEPSINGSKATDSVDVGGGKRRFLYHLVGNRRWQLTLSKGEPAAAVMPFGVVRPRITYELSPQGLQLAAEFRFDVHAASPQKLEFDIDPELTLVSARLHDSAVSWSVGDQPLDGGRKRVSIELAKPLAGSNVAVRMLAVGKLIEQRDWKLPSIVARGATWQDGTAVLAIATPLSLRRLDLTSCRQTKRETLPGPALGEAIEIQAYTQAASITVQLAQQQERLTVISGANVELSSEKTMVSYAALITADQGERFEIAAAVSPAWIIDSVQSAVNGMIAEWEIQPDGDEASRLVIRLAMPVNPDRPLPLSIRATRRRASLGNTLGVKDLQLLEFPGIKPTRQLALVRTAPPFGLRIRGASSLARLDSLQLDEAARSLLGDVSQGITLKLDDSADNLQIELLPQQTRYSASLETRIAIDRSRLVESYRLNVVPELNKLDRVLVYISEGDQANLIWELDGKTDQCTASRLSDAERATRGLPASGEIWEIAFNPERTEPFVLTSTRTRDWQKKSQAGLPAMLDSASQRGKVLVELPGDFMPKLAAQGLKPLPVAAPPADSYSDVVADYSYEPLESTVAQGPSLAISADTATGHRRNAWIWRGTLNVWLSNSERAFYRTSFFVENQGRSRVDIRMPDAATPLVTIDAKTDSAGVVWNEQSQTLQIPLPHAKRFCRIDIASSGGKSSLSGLSRRSFAWPTADVPILRREATVWLPADYDLADVDNGWLARTSGVSWSERLFGPLGRSGEEEVFKPWRADRWLRLLALDDEDANQAQIRRSSIEPLGPVPPPIWPATPLFSDDIHSIGWRAYSIDSPDGDLPIDVLIVRHSSLYALSAALFLTTLGLSWWFRLRRPGVSVGALGLAVVLALLLPAPLSPLGCAAVLGILCGWAIRYCLSSPPLPAVRVVSGQAAAAATASLLLAVLLYSATLGQPKETEQSVPAEEIYDVLVPMSSDEQIAQDKVYVPEPLYLKISPQQPEGAAEARYVITQAVYEALEKKDGADTASLPYQSWKADLVIEPLQAPARVFLPFGFDGAQVIPDSGRINGKPLHFSRDEARHGITFELDSTARAVVEFEFQPRRESTADSEGVAFAIPKMPQARIQLPLATSGSDLRFESLGGTRTADNSKLLIADIGPLERVAIRWKGNAAPAMPPQFDCDECSWLKLKPGSALLNTRFAIRVSRGELHEVAIKLDERLQLVTIPSDLPIADVQRVSKDRLRIRFATPIRDNAALNLAFVVAGASGEGELAWPNLELAGAQSRRRFVAWSIDPSLELVGVPPPAFKPMNALDFTTLWGAAEVRPPAFELPVALSAWTLQVRPRQPSLTGDYRTSVTVHANHAELRWNAALNIAGGSKFQFRVTVPVEASIDRVEVRDAVGIRTSSWARDTSGLLTVFLSAPATGQIRLSLNGRLPFAEGQLSIPRLQVEATVAGASQLVIARSPQALVDLGNLAKGAQLEPAAVNGSIAESELSADASKSLLPLSLFVAAVDTMKAAEPLVVRVGPNHPHIEAVQAISLKRRNEHWEAALDVKLRVSNGMVDSIRMTAPPSWAEPFSVQPDVPFEVRAKDSDRDRELVLYPPKAIADEATFHIEGRLSPLAGQRIRAPDVRLQGADKLDQYIVLPLREELQALQWDTNGLAPQAVPLGLVAAPDDPSSIQTFLRTAEAFRADLRSVAKFASSVQVRLADIAVRWATNGTCYGVAAFDLEPAGRTTCRLALPSGYRLIDLAVDHRLLPPVAVGEQRWEIPLGDGRLPVRIELVFAGPWPVTASTGAQFERPRLIGIPAVRTIWTVAGPDWAGAGHALNADTQSAAYQQAERVRMVGSLITSAANTLSESTPELAHGWFESQARRMMSGRQSLANLVGRDRVTDWIDEGDLNHVVEDTAERFAATDSTWQMTSNASPDRSSRMIWEGSLATDQNRLCAATTGDAPSIALVYPDAAHGNLALRILQAILACAVLLGAFVLLRRAARRDWLVAHPRPIAAGIGLFWWLCLAPSVLGLMLVVLASARPYLWRIGPGRWLNWLNGRGS